MNSPVSRVPLLLVEDHPVIRNGIRLFLEQSGRYTVCAETDRADDVLALISMSRPAVVLLDLLLGGKDALALIAQIVAAHRDCRVLVFSMLQETVYAERALRAGATGYLMKSAPPEEFLLALDNVCQGRAYLSPRTFARVFRDARLSRTADPKLDRLSDRELQLFQMIGAGLPNREIARHLGISVKTVEAHRENIKNKLDLADASELAAASTRFVETVRL